MRKLIIPAFFILFLNSLFFTACKNEARNEANKIVVDTLDAVSSDTSGQIKMCTEMPRPINLGFGAIGSSFTTKSGKKLEIGAIPSTTNIAVLKDNLWKKKVLKVRFMDGDTAVHRRVKACANTWSKYANIKFDYGDYNDADLRVSFKLPGSWSYIGTDALEVPKSMPTINLGWLSKDSPQSEIDRVVLHEFGHVMGCIHEHQNPAADIPWDKPAVYAFYKQTQGWGEDDVETNIFKRYSSSETNFTAFDTKSIMLYAIDERLTVGKYSTFWNYALSPTDKEFIGRIYPFETGLESITLEIPKNKNITQDDQIDIYTLDIKTERKYVIETTGNLDLVMYLYGPNSQKNSALVAKDDDSGTGSNPRIIKTLSKGKYYVRVRHFLPKGRGNYVLSARKAV
jgi:Bacterial pre-peptidase C-terminal domain/Astacin (Peptidase family M12A)